MKLYTATIDYSATGEGRTIIFLAVGAENEEHARERFLTYCEVNPYFFIGATIYEGLPPEDDSVVNILVSSRLLTSLKAQAEKLDCMLATRLQHHFNYG